MEKLKKILLKLLFPHIAIVILTVPLSAVLLVYAFAVPGANETVAYVSYFVSAYGLTILCCRIPQIICAVRRIKEDNKYVRLYLTDAHLRIKLSLYIDVFINAAYVLLQLYLGITSGSFWYYAMTAYYAIMALMQYFLLKETLKEAPGSNVFMELLHYRFCGILLLLLNMALAVIVLYIVYLNRGSSHHEIVTIALAAHTFASLTKSIIGVFRYRKYNSPVFSATKAIGLASALVSMLTLETAMLTAFGQENGPQFRQIMTGATGTAICAFIFVMAVMMIVRSTKEINRIKKESSKHE